MSTQQLSRHAAVTSTDELDILDPSHPDWALNHESTLRLARSASPLESWIDFAWRSWNTHINSKTSAPRPGGVKKTNNHHDPHSHTFRDTFFSYVPSISSASPHYHRSRSSDPTRPNVLDNSPPSFIPPARIVTTVNDVGDRAHFSISVLLGKSANSSSNLPDRSSIPVRLLLDTGSSDLVLFNRTLIGTCADGLTRICGNSLYSPSFIPDPRGTLGHFGVRLDGEMYAALAGGVGSDLVTVMSNLIGTSQVDYKLQQLRMYVVDGMIYTQRASDANFDPIENPLINTAFYDKVDGSEQQNCKDHTSTGSSMISLPMSSEI